MVPPSNIWHLPERAVCAADRTDPLPVGSLENAKAGDVTLDAAELESISAAVAAHSR